MNSEHRHAAPAVALRHDAGVIGLVGIAHLISHFSQLLLAPLFPWLKDAFNASYTELGFLMTMFFVVSCAVQTTSGFLVDRFGPRPILFAGLALVAWRPSASRCPNYSAMAFFSVIAGIGNGVFHPVDYTLLNRKVSAPRLGHAYSVHGITGSLGWALAPALLVPLAIVFGWRVALGSRARWPWRCSRCSGSTARSWNWPSRTGTKARRPGSEGSLDFLRIPAVWMCFAFFFFYAVVLSVVQAFAPEAARHLHDVPVAMAAVCLTVYMVCSAGGMVWAAFSRPTRRAASGWSAPASAWRLWSRWRSASRRCRRSWCRCCSAPWALPAALPGRRATCW